MLQYMLLTCIYCYLLTLWHLLPVGAEEEQKWRHAMNGVALSPSSHVTSGTEGATSTASLWTPAASPPNSLKSAPSSDCPLNLTVSRTTRRFLSPPCPSADARTATGSVSRRQAEDSPVHGSPPPAHHPYTVAKSDNLTARKSAIPNNEVL